MVLVDINILSTFARVGEMRLLWKLFPGESLGVTPTTCQETLEAVRLGCGFLQESMELIRSGKLQLVSPSVEEVVAQEALPGAFSLADKECLTLSQSRGYALLTNDRRLRNFCREQGVAVYDLPQLLRALWRKKIVSKKRVHQILERMEQAEGIVVKNREAIFVTLRSSPG